MIYQVLDALTINVKISIFHVLPVVDNFPKVNYCVCLTSTASHIKLKHEGHFLTSGNNPIKSQLACAYTCVIYHWKG